MPPKKVVSQPKGRPAFVGKLWQMVNDPENDPYIRWMPDGKSIQVVNREAFEKTLLPKYFKHANFSSFVRQLNMYGWHKVQDLQAGSMHNGDENWQFQSPNFVRGHEELLDRIVRNKGSAKHDHDEDDHDISRVVRELEQIKSKQITIGEDLFRIRKDNELLWSEYHQNREKYEQHSQMLDKILHFLASVYGQNGGKVLDGMMGPMPGTKRRFITQMPEPPSYDGERIQEIQEMKVLQDKINKSSSDTPMDPSTPESPNHGDVALVPFNRNMAPYPKPHAANPPRGPMAGLMGGGGGGGGGGGSAPSRNDPLNALGMGATINELTDPSALDPTNPALQQIASNQNEIDTLANQLAMQDLSLQQVQDWISNMGPNNEYLGEAGTNPPTDFDVNDFINADMDDATPEFASEIKQEGV